MQSKPTIPGRYRRTFPVDLWTFCSFWFSSLSRSFALYNYMVKNQKLIESSTKQMFIFHDFKLLLLMINWNSKISKRAMSLSLWAVYQTWEFQKSKIFRFFTKFLSLSFDFVGICFSSITFILICGLYNVAWEGIPVSCFKEGRRSITVISEPYIWNLQMGLWSSAHGTHIDFRVSYRRVITCLQFKRGCKRTRFLMSIIDKNWRKSRS